MIATQPSPPPVQILTRQTDPELRARVAELERDLKSVRARNAVLLRFRNERDGETTHIATARGAATVGPILNIAQLIEQRGRVPCIRFTRDAAGVITGIELAALSVAADDEALDAPRAPAGMAVVGDDDTAEACL